MFPSASSRSTLRFWAPTGLAGTLATASVTVLTSAVLSAPSSAYPTDRVPVGPTSVLASRPAGGPDLVTPLCFMGRHSWAVDLVGTQPRCSR